jgi:two-component system, cell cycle sensor histidine kinase and response regulator CckA
MNREAALRELRHSDMKSFPRWLIVASGLAMLALIGGGYWFYLYQEQDLRQKSEANLQAAVQLKVNQIEEWRSEQLRDAAANMKSPLFTEAVERFLAESSTELADKILSQFRAMEELFHYRDVMLVDRDGQVRLSLSKHVGSLHEDAARSLAEALREKKPVLSDLHVGPADLPAHIDVVAPLFSETRKAEKPVGAVIIQLDARQFLYPLIQFWPTPSLSAETLLVRRDGEAVLFLNDLRHQPDTAFKLKMPLTRKDVPAVMAVLGKEGIVQGKDYRGVDVLCVLKAIPNSPWFMIAKVDEAEVLSDWRFRSILILALVIGLLAFLFTAVGMAWQKNGKAHYKQLFLAEAALRKAEEGHRITLMSVGDGIISTDIDGRVELVNPVAEALTGWRQEEARGKSLEEVFRIFNEDTRRSVENPVSKVLREGLVVGLANHTVLVAQDGTERPIADSAAPIRDENGEITGVVLVFRDQSKERAAQKALTKQYQELEETHRRATFLADLVEKSSQPLAVGYPDGRIGTVNEAFYRLTGYNKDEIATTDWANVLTPPEWQEKERNNLEELRRTSQPVRYEKEYIRKDGTRVPIELLVHLVRDESGAPQHYYAFINDITERKRSEEALQGSASMLRGVLAASPIGIVLTQDRKVHWANDAWEKMFGFDNECEYVDQPTSIMHSSHQNYEHVRKMLYDNLSPGEVSETEATLARKNGTLFDAQISVNLLDPLDPSKGAISAISDISQRKRTEGALRESEERFRKIFDFAPDPYFLIDVQGRFLDGNLAAEEMIGYEKAELIGKTFLEVAILLPEQIPVAFELLKASARGKPTGPNELGLVRKDGQPVDVEIRTFPIQMEEKTVVLGIARDISERKRSEEALRESEERYRSLFENMPEGLAYCQMFFEDGKPQDFVYLDVNDSFERLTGLKEVVGKKVTEVIPGIRESNPELFEVYGRVALTGNPERFETYVDPLGIWFSISAYSSERECFVAVFDNITERKRAEEALRNLLDFRQTLIDAIPNPVFYKDLESKYIGCNEAFAVLVGLPKKEVVGKSVQEVVPKELGDIWREKDLELFDRTHVQVFEFTMRHPDGTEHSFINHKAPFFDIDGALAGLIGVMVDITDRLRAEEAVRQSEEWYRALVENSFDGIFIQRGPKIIFANSHLYDILGYSQGELEGMDHWVIYHPEYQEIARERAMARMRDEDVEPQYEVKLVRKDASTFDGEISARAVKVKGEPGVQVWVRDVSKRKRSEEAQRRLATAVEQVAEAIVITDAQGNIQYVNPACERITGYTREEFIGEKPSLLKSDDYDVAFYEKLLETLSKGESWAGRLSKKRKDGTPYEEDVTISPVRDTSDRIINFVGIMREVTQEVLLQKQLIQAQKMEAVGTLSGGIAHDFNNLLQVILGYSELLLAEKREDDSEYADLSKIFQAGKSGAELVQRLLTFSRKVEPNPIPLNLNRRILQVEKLLRRSIPKMIGIQMDLSDDLAEIHADPIQMEQVLMNLAVNARDAMPDRGKLTVGTKNVMLDEEYCRVHAGAKPGEYVLLTVSDTGHGMDKATIEHIFEPFYTTKELGRGTGLGLAMVYGIVKQHGGYISCYSEVGHGTSFNIYLPAIESQVEPEVDKTVVMPAFGTETILLVDDEEFVRDLGARILSKAGYNVLTATNGREALDLFEKERTQISLVILDLIMPEMGGKECLKELREIDPELKVLIASGLSADPSTKESVEMGARGFVSKPFRFKELLQQLRKALDES